MNIILYQPQIPPNTGNIVRTCAATGASLFLVPPLGFSISSRHLKRAGLDHWEGVSVTLLEELEPFLETTSAPFFFFSSKGSKSYTDASYAPGNFLIFGSETSGLPPQYRKRWPENFYKIPQKEKARCLNLSNAVAVVLYEAWRQHSFR